MGISDYFNSNNQAFNNTRQAQQQHLNHLNNLYARQIGKQLASPDLALQRLLKTKPLPQLPANPVTRIAEIDAELDIIRGRVSTPKGYKIDPRKAKALMNERTELAKKLSE